MAYQYMEYKNDNGIARVNINRPDKRNALCQELMEEMIDIFQKIDKDETVKVAVLTGNGKTFVAGADIAVMSQLNAPEYLEYGAILYRVMDAIRDNSKPVIAAVNGIAFGGGNVIVLACDIIIAADNAKFSQPEIHLGMFGGGAFLPSLVGRYRASEIVLLGDPYTAEEAYRMGLANKVVPLDELEKTVTEMAGKIAEKSPLAVRLGKKSLLGGTYSNLKDASAQNLALISVMFGSHDQKEGMKAFLEKRSPVWQGK